MGACANPRLTRDLEAAGTTHMLPGYCLKTGRGAGGKSNDLWDRKTEDYGTV